MNSSALTHKTPHPARSIRTHLDHEHEIISKELITLRSIVFSEVHDVFAEIDFRNRLEWITRSIETHLTSEERVVLKYLYTADDYSIQKNCIENVCQINREIDRVLDELDRCPWSKIQAIQSLVSLLEHLFNLHVRYENAKLFQQLTRIPRVSQKTMVKELISIENNFLEWLLQMELSKKESFVH